MVSLRQREGAKIVCFIIFSYAVLILIPSIGKYLWFIPMTGALLRFRVNYTPRPRFPDVDDVHQRTETGDRARLGWYFDALAKMLTLEGWSGAFKGTVPALIPLSLKTLCMLVPFVPYRVMMFWPYILANMLPERYRFPGYSDFAVALICLPYEVTLIFLANRAITTPHRLPFRTSPKKAFQTLLSPSEYARPWTIPFSMPMRSILATRLFYAAFRAFVFVPLRSLINNNAALRVQVKSIEDVPWFAAACALVMLLNLFAVSIAVLTPLEMVCVRLSVLYPGQGYETELGKQGSSVEPEVGDAHREKVEEPKEDLGEERKRDTEQSLTTGSEHPRGDNGLEGGLEAPSGVQGTAEAMQSAESKPDIVAEPHLQAFRLRHESYAGPIACARLILAEEGPRALWRSWWVVGLALLALPLP